MNSINRIGKYLQPGRLWYKRSISGITKLVVHHSATYTQGKTNDQMLQELYNIHVANGWPGLSYHRVITPDGTIYIINNIDDLTWTDSHNDDAYATCLIGYFHPNGSTPAMQPTQAQLRSLKICLDELSTEHPEFPADEDDVVGHKDRWATACPGDTLYPYVTEYRVKQGQVDWDGSNPSPVTPPDCLIPNTSENRTRQQQLTESDTKFKEVLKLMDIQDDPYATPTDKVKSVLAGYKSRETDLTNKLGQANIQIGIKDQEIVNRKEQVGRLEQLVLDKEKYYSGLIDALNKQLQNAGSGLPQAMARIGVLEGQLDEANKEKGRALLDMAEWQKRAESCEAGTPLPQKSWWQKILDLFNKK